MERGRGVTDAMASVENWTTTMKEMGKAEERRRSVCCTSNTVPVPPSTHIQLPPAALTMASAVEAGLYLSRMRRRPPPPEYGCTMPELPITASPPSNFIAGAHDKCACDWQASP